MSALSLSENRNAVVRRYRGRAFLSMGEHSVGNRKQHPAFRGVNLSTDEWSAIKTNIPAIEEAIKKLQSRSSRSQSTQNGDASGAVDDTSHQFFHVETSRFDGKNYLCWVSQMEIFLKQLNLAYVLTEPCPSSSSAPQTNPNETTRSKAAKQNWIRDDYFCHHHLLNSLSDHLYHQYSKKNFKSAKELWDELKWVYQIEESSSRSHVRKYMEFKIVEERPILEQVQDFNKIADNIISAGMFLDENFHLSAIISKFPPSWKGFCIKLMQEEFLPVWMLMEHVKAEEEFRRYGTRKDMTRIMTNFHMERRMSTGTRQRGTQNLGWKRKGAERQARPIMVCNNCGKKGHPTKDCWAKKSDKRGSAKPNEDASAASPVLSGAMANNVEVTNWHTEGENVMNLQSKERRS
ncbi:PREDICTED: uncharacterized protein LOC104801367 isoform X2 [Tarenaya hassleriana]|uniref:uncharacterized protein LOC104801367 isoform X2 n=1 Tax=Tarenaya hassleriana TaxID=28532 RepID=UPI00053C1ACF|nr:PREDICTED: uncharacterized protein LOC104801367 isoform X2 [Tarenaya hassleriana]